MVIFIDLKKPRMRYIDLSNMFDKYEFYSIPNDYGDLIVGYIIRSNEKQSLS